MKVTTRVRGIIQSIASSGHAVLSRLGAMSVARRWAIITGSVLVAVIFTQLLLPSRVMPRTYLAGSSIAFKSIEEIKQQLEEQSQAITLKLDSDSKHYTAADAGIVLDVEATLASLRDVSITDKLVPFSPFVQSMQRHDVAYVIHRDDAKVHAFAMKVAAEMSRPPQDAVPSIKDGIFTITDAQVGRSYTAEAIKTILMREDIFAGTAPAVGGTATEAKIQKNDLVGLEDQFKKLTSQKLTILYGDKKVDLDPKTIAAWLMVSKTEGGYKLAVNPDAAHSQIVAWAKDYSIPAGITQVTTMDGVETARTSGSSGRRIDEAVVIAQLGKWVDSPSATSLTLATSAIAPKIVYTRFYSASSAGLQAKLESWIDSHGGRRYQVAIQELGGQGRVAAYDVDSQTVMASTYKLYVAFAAFRQAEVGALDLNKVIYSGKTIAQCIDPMIVQSNNECAVAIGNYIGWRKMDDIVHAAGFPSVKLNNYTSGGALNGDKMVNASDQAKFLSQLSSGVLMSAEHTNTLLGYMKRQVYRSGIPAGSRGAVVADKVGFLSYATHDVGIVYGAKSTYALVIMSDGANNWANIKDLALAIYDFMNE